MIARHGYTVITSTYIASQHWNRSDTHAIAADVAYRFGVIIIAWSQKGVLISARAINAASVRHTRVKHCTGNARANSCQVSEKEDKQNTGNI